MSNDHSPKSNNSPNLSTKHQVLPYVFESKNNKYLKSFLKRLFYYYDRNELDLNIDRMDQNLKETSIDIQTLNFREMHLLNPNKNNFINLSEFDEIDNSIILHESIKNNILEENSNKKFHLASFLGTKEVEELILMKLFIEERLKKNKEHLDSDMRLFFKEMLVFIILMIENKNKMEQDDDASLNQSVLSRPCESLTDKEESEYSPSENKFLIKKGKTETVINLHELKQFENKTKLNQNKSDEDDGRNQLIKMKNKNKKFISHSSNRVTFKSSKNNNFYNQNKLQDNDNFFDVNKGKLMSNIFPDKILINPYRKNSKNKNPGLVSKHFINEDVNSSEAYNYLTDLQNHEKIIKEGYEKDKVTNVKSSLFSESSKNLRRFSDAFKNESFNSFDFKCSEVEVDLSKLDEVIKKIGNKSKFNKGNKNDEELDVSSIRKNRNSSFKYKTNLDLGVLLNEIPKVRQSSKNSKNSKNSDGKSIRNKKDPEFKYKTNLDLGHLLNDTKISTSNLKDYEMERENEIIPIFIENKNLKSENEDYNNCIDCNLKNGLHKQNIEESFNRSSNLKRSSSKFKKEEITLNNENNYNNCENKNIEQDQIDIETLLVSPIPNKMNNYFNVNSFNDLNIDKVNNLFIPNYKKKVELKITKIPLDIYDSRITNYTHTNQQNKKNPDLKITHFSEEINNYQFSISKENCDIKLNMKTEQSNFELMGTKYTNTEQSEMNLISHSDKNIIRHCISFNCNSNKKNIFTKKRTVGSFSKTNTHESKEVFRNYNLENNNNCIINSKYMGNNYIITPQGENKNHNDCINILVKTNSNEKRDFSFNNSKEISKSFNNDESPKPNLSKFNSESTKIRSVINSIIIDNSNNSVNKLINKTENYKGSNSEIERGFISKRESSKLINYNLNLLTEISNSNFKSRMKRSLVMPSNDLFKVKDCMRIKQFRKNNFEL